MAVTTPVQPYCKILADTDHMGYDIEITEFKCTKDSYEWDVPNGAMQYLKKRPVECWSNTLIYHMRCTLRYGPHYRVPSNVICYIDKTTQKPVHYCDICDPYLIFWIRPGPSINQAACVHSGWFSLYIDQV